jgi:hypothetical protein
MIVAVTALQVALVSSIAALVAAIMTPVITWIVTSMRNRHERWTHVYQDRRDAYLALLRLDYALLGVARNLNYAVSTEGPSEPPTPDTGFEPQELVIARAALYSPEHVMKQVRAFGKAYVESIETLKKVEAAIGGTPDEKAAAATTLRPHLDELEEAMAVLRQHVRDDLVNRRRR